MPYRYTKNSVKLYIPKTLIEAFHPHPEPYGDQMVSLKNGMYTDIYEGESGYYTLTNDLVLVEYVKKKGKLK